MQPFQKRAMALLCLLSTIYIPASAMARGVQPASFKVFPTDIFNNDSTTRRPAKTEELKWTVNVGGCSGHMLSTKYLLTANHCSPSAGSKYTSGGCMVLGCKGDLQAVKVVESNAALDYSIVEVKWLRTDSAWKQRYTPQIQIGASEVTTGRDGVQTKIFTVGFPTDKHPTAMYAEGYAKARSGSSLRYNIGIINGNSGGAVWRSDDYTLVSMTNNGPHAFGQPGWNDNDPEDADALNGGSAMDKITPGAHC
jgi:hypothetical protein